MSEYIVNEDGGSVEVCAVITDVARTEIDINVIFNAVPGDKAGKMHTYVDSIDRYTDKMTPFLATKHRMGKNLCSAWRLDILLTDCYSITSVKLCSMESSHVYPT